MKTAIEEISRDHATNSHGHGLDGSLLLPGQYLASNRHLRLNPSRSRLLEPLSHDIEAGDGPILEEGTETSTSSLSTASEDSPNDVENNEFSVNSLVHERSMANFQNKSHTQRQRMRRSTLDLMKQKNLWNLRQSVKYAFWTMWAILVMNAVGLGGWAFPDGNDPSACAEALERNKKTCTMGESLSQASQNLLFLTGFVLGGFVMSSRSLWLKRRSSYQDLCRATRNMLLHSISIAPEADKKLFARWTILGYELSVLKARLLMDSAEGKRYLMALNLVSQAEWEAMAAGDRHDSVWFWVQAKAKQICDEKEITSSEFLLISTAVTAIRDKADDLMSCLDRDQPLPYVFVCAMLVNINLFFYASSQGMKFAVWMQDAGGLQIWIDPSFYLSVVTVYLFTTIFAMLFDVCALLYNPFGPRSMDIPHHVVSEGIRKLAKSLVKSSHPDRCVRQLSKKLSIIEGSLTGAALDAERNIQMKSPQLGKESLIRFPGHRRSSV